MKLSQIETSSFSPRALRMALGTKIVSCLDPSRLKSESCFVIAAQKAGGLATYRFFQHYKRMIHILQYRYPYGYIHENVRRNTSTSLAALSLKYTANHIIEYEHEIKIFYFFAKTPVETKIMSRQEIILRFLFMRARKSRGCPQRNVVQRDLHTYPIMPVVPSGTPLRTQPAGKSNPGT